METERNKNVDREESWPEDPYKGLTFFSPEDVPLYAGREDDVRRVNDLISRGDARLLLLHGPTGCGKSSFLRAGLIPFTEGQTGAFRFARDPDDFANTLFVRSSGSPIDRLASKIQGYVSKAIESDLGVSFEESRVLAALPEEDPVEFADACYDDPDYLVTILEEIALNQPRTQVLIVDQAEEVLTLFPDEEGDEWRDRFFEFLAILSATDFDLKMIVTFRDEYHGMFYSKLRAAGAEPGQIQDYYLGELSEADLVRAIERPTSDKKVDGYRRLPRDVYGFEFENGLAKEIAGDLLEQAGGASALPILQIVCRQLYQSVRELDAASDKSPDLQPRSRVVTITEKSYRQVGAIEGQIDGYLQQALRQALGTRRYRLQRETMRWRDILSHLARSWPDGSVTTDVVKREKLEKKARQTRTDADFQTTMDSLEGGGWKIVRSAVWAERGTNLPVECYSLGHDVLGTVLHRWRRKRDEDQKSVTRGLFVWGLAFVLFSAFVVGSFGEPLIAIGPVSLGAMQTLGISVGLALWLLAAIPKRPRWLWLHRPVYGFILDTMAQSRLP